MGPNGSPTGRTMLNELSMAGYRLVQRQWIGESGWIGGPGGFGSDPAVIAAYASALQGPCRPLLLGEEVTLPPTAEIGGNVVIHGFAFPVAGPTNFIDSFGFPRMTGTEYEHWHEGTDIARSRDWGDLYMRATAKYAEAFRKGVRLEPRGEFINASRVRWSGRDVAES